ncbi:alpha/beta fold hydrolase [Nocardioides limicola]|uniref:alpha/beta fold hydrolase n=1 Tax=Nocardioides limicola TaxID=2803368 RepID=UPI00193B9EAC|nr:alpha/beta hydrolase [Nocardioides sp. DJM-14]
MPETRMIPVGEVSLFIRELGTPRDGQAPLLVVHGGPDWDHSYLLPPMQELGRHRQVIMVDLRGCGRSTRGLGPQRYQPEFVVDDLVALITSLGHRQVDLLGFSTGGQIAQLLAAARPELLRSLILASTTAYPDARQLLEDWPDYQQRAAMTVPSPGWVARETDPDTLATINWAIDSAPTSVWNLDLLDDYLDLLSRVRFTGEWIVGFRAGLLHPWRPDDPEEVLRSFPGPVLILHGAQDMCFSVQVAKRLHAAVPATRLRVIEEAGHMTHLDQPEAWVRNVAEFLAH